MYAVSFDMVINSLESDINIMGMPQYVADHDRAVSELEEKND